MLGAGVPLDLRKARELISPVAHKSIDCKQLLMEIDMKIKQIEKPVPEI
jgi:hypothetical protein